MRLLPLLVALLLAACGGASEGARPSQDKPELERVRLTYATSGGGQLFARLAADNGLFHKYGLNAGPSRKASPERTLGRSPPPCAA